MSGSQARHLGGAWKSQPKQKLDGDISKNVSLAPQPKRTQETRSFAKDIPTESKRNEPSARDLLATISGRRIAITEIRFADCSSKGGGYYADVVVAALVRARSGMEDPKAVAVKKFRFVLDSYMTEEKFIRVFLNELLILEKLSHPNIVEIIGFVEDVENRIAWLVFPWEENGNLREFLRSGEWEIPERVSLIQDVSFGLEYLHSQQPPICHGDLKSLNILVNSEHRAKITDFGSARIIREVRDLGAPLAPQSAASTSCLPPRNNERPQFKVTLSGTTLTLTGPACSFRWAPPEVLDGAPTSLSSDIWALGWIAWEAITDRYPFEDLDKERDITTKILKGQLPLIHDHNQLSQISSLCSLMQDCWKLEPNERPFATECSRRLKWIPSTIPVTKSSGQPTPRSAALFFQLGEIHGSQSRYEEASKMYEQGLAIASSCKDRRTVAYFHLRLAGVHRARSMLVEAEDSYTLAMAIHRSIGDDMGHAQSLAGLGRIHRERSNYVEAEASFTKAMAIQQRIGDDVGRANTLVGLGYVQSARSDYAKAGASLTQALAIHESMGNDRGRAEALVGLGHVHSARVNYGEAEASYKKAAAVSRAIGNDVGRACALLGLGRIQSALSNHVEAEASYTQASLIYASIGCDLRQAEALVDLGHAQRALSNYVDAEDSYTRAKVIYESLGNDRGRARMMIAIGYVQRERFKYNEAEASYHQALVISNVIGNNLGRACAYLGLGHVHRACSNYSLAETTYTRAMAICGSIGYDLGCADSSLGLGEIRLHQSRYPEAKALIEAAARISGLHSYDWGKRASKTLLEEILKAENSSIKSRPLPLAPADS